MTGYSIRSTRQSDPASQVLALALLTCLGVLAAVVAALWAFRASTIESSRKLNTSFAHIVEEQTSRSLQVVDQRLELAASAFLAMQAKGAVNDATGRQFLREQIRQLPLLRAMWILDASGRISFDSDVGNIGLNLADRPYFQTYLKSPELEFRLADPVRSRTTGGWLISATRPLRDSKGKFLGVIVAAVEPPYFDQLWRSIDLGEDGTIALIRRNGVLLMRSPLESELFGQVRPDLKVIAELADSKSEGTFEKQSSYDGRLRLFAYKRLSVDPQLAVVVGQSKDVLLAQWRRITYLALGLWAAGSVLLGLQSRRLARALNAEAAGKAALQENEQNLAVTLQSIGDAVIATTPAGTVTRMNRAAERLTGWPLQEARGRELGEIFRILDSQTRSLLPDPVQSAIEHGQVQNQTNSMLLISRDGSERQIAACEAPIRAADGSVQGVVLVFSDVTAAFLANEALRSNEQRLRTLLANLRSGVLVHDTDTRLVEVNQSACRILGLTEAQLLGKEAMDPFWQLLREDLSPVPIDEFPVNLVLASGKPVQDLLLGIQRADLSRPAWGLCNAFPLFDGQGRIYQVVVTVSDITERKYAEQDSRAARQSLRATLDAIPDLMFELDKDGRYCAVHAPQPQLLAAPLESLIGSLVDDVLPAQASSSVHAALSEAADKGHSWGKQFSLPLEVGAKWFELSVSRIATEQDDMAHFVVLARDITSRKLTEIKLEQVNRTLRVMSRCSALALQASDEQQFLLNLCEAIVDLGGFDLAWVGFAERDAAKTVRIVAKAGQASEELAVVPISWDTEAPAGSSSAGKAIASGLPQINLNFEAQSRHHAWQSVARSNNLRCSAALPVISAAQVRGALTVYASSEQAFDDSNVGLLQELAQNVSISLQAYGARSQRDEANVASRAKSTFLAHMSHEIRTPMNAILGMNYLLRQTSLTKDQLNRVERVDAAGRHLLSLINDILDLSKIEAGAVSLHPVDFVVASMLDDVRGMVAETANRKGLQLTITHDGLPARLHGDETRIRQAVLNLVSNAVKFTESGFVAIQAQTEGESEGSLLIKFSVRDSGIGIVPDALRKLFNAFEQVRNVGRADGGTGLGLAITRQLATLMGGSVGVESQPGVGSHFWFTAKLELAKGPDVIASPAPCQSNADEQLRDQFPGARVLVVEDNDVNREIITAMLLPLKFEVDCAEDGLKALELAATTPYDLVLMDLQMPGLDGLTATRKLRSLPGWADTPVVALTADVLNESRLECQSAGMNDFLSKPVEPALLYACLLRCMRPN